MAGNRKRDFIKCNNLSLSNVCEGLADVGSSAIAHFAVEVNVHVSTFLRLTEKRNKKGYDSQLNGCNYWFHIKSSVYRNQRRSSILKVTTAKKFFHSMQFCFGLEINRCLYEGDKTVHA
jgi:hypothetical protein